MSLFVKSTPPQQGSSRLLLMAGNVADTMIEVVMYLSPRDIFELICTSKVMKECFDNVNLWSMLCRNRISGLRIHFSQNKSYLDSLCTLLETTSYKQVFICLHNLQHALFGWFRLIPFSPDHCHGGFYHIFPSTVDNRICCYHTDEFGHYADDDTSYTLSFSPQYQCLQAISILTHQPYTIKIMAGGLRLNPLTVPAANIITSDFITLVPLPRFVGSSIAKDTPFEYHYVKPAIGLFHARYGSHGTEILQLSLHRAPDVTWIPPLEQIHFGHLQLQGLKITGDPNVPANQYSFCINLDQPVDIPTAYAEDSRPIIMFPVHQHAPIVADWQDRLPRIKLWAKGYGQINRHPPVWNPEWVKCNFILYDRPIDNPPNTAAHPAAFSILWDDETDFFRHAMDFVSLPHELVDIAMQTASSHS